MASQVTFSAKNRLKYTFKNWASQDPQDLPKYSYSEPFEIDNSTWKIGIEVRNQNQVWSFLSCENAGKKWIAAATNIDFISFDDAENSNNMRNPGYPTNSRRNFRPNHPSNYDSVEVEREEIARKRRKIEEKEEKLENIRYFTSSQKCTESQKVPNSCFIYESGDSQIEICVEFSFIFYDFGKKEENSDILFRIGEGKEELYLSKALFTIASDYFFKLFITEKSTQQDIDIENVTIDEFLSFLVAIHPTSIKTPDFHRKKVVELAEIYQIRSIHLKNEAFLMGQKKKMDKMELLKEAEKYGYEKMAKSCINSLDSCSAVKMFVKSRDFEQFKPETQASVLKHILNFV